MSPESVIFLVVGVGLTAVATSLILRQLILTVRQRVRLDALQRTIEKSPSGLDRYVSVLLQRHAPPSGQEVPQNLSALAEMQPIKQYIFIAYMLWASGDLERAIRVAEAGLDRAQSTGESFETLLRFKNSLAYYYADARISEKEELAREYAEEAYRGRPGSPAVIDTLGYVRIQFGRTREEVLAGMELCELAYKQGYPYFYEKHFKSAGQRLAELEAGRIAERAV